MEWFIYSPNCITGYLRYFITRAWARIILMAHPNKSSKSLSCLHDTALSLQEIERLKLYFSLRLLDIYSSREFFLNEDWISPHPEVHFEPRLADKSEPHWKILVFCFMLFIIAELRTVHAIPRHFSLSTDNSASISISSNRWWGCFHHAEQNLSKGKLCCWFLKWREAKKLWGKLFSKVKATSMKFWHHYSG